MRVLVRDDEDEACRSWGSCPVSKWSRIVVVQVPAFAR